MRPRRIPDKLFCGKHGSQITAGSQSRATGPGDGFTAPILVTVHLMCGCRRKFGVEKAWINSYLEFCVDGGFVNDKNELARAWPIAKEGLSARDYAGNNIGK